MSIFKNLLPKKKKNIEENLKELGDEEAHKLILKFRKGLRTLIDEKEQLEYKLNEEEKKEYNEKIKKYLLAISNIERRFFNLKHGIYLGMKIPLNFNDDRVTPFYLDPKKISNHTGVFGSTGVGKTVLMLTTIKQKVETGENLIIVDPKGGPDNEVLSATAQFCYVNGRSSDLMYISPAFPSLSTTLNPLYGMSNSEISSLIRTLADTDGDAFFIDTAENVIKGICSALTYLQKVTDPTGNLIKEIEINEFANYLAQMRTKTTTPKFDMANQILDPSQLEIFEEEFYREKENEKIHEEVIIRDLITFKDLAYYASYKNFEALGEMVEKTRTDMTDLPKAIVEEIEDLREEAINAMRTTLDQGPEFYSKISSSLANLLTGLSTGPIGEIFCSTRINPLLYKLLQKKSGVVCVIQPFPMMFKADSNKMIKVVLKFLENFLGTVGSSGKLAPRWLNIFIDEAASVMYKGFVEIANKGRGLGATLFLYSQSFADYEEVIGDAASKQLFDNINTHIYMRVNDAQSAERIANSIGSYKRPKSSTILDHTENKFSIAEESEKIAEQRDITSMKVGSGIVRYDGKYYMVDFPHYGNIERTIQMPPPEREKKMKLYTEIEENSQKNQKTKKSPYELHQESMRVEQTPADTPPH